MAVLVGSVRHKGMWLLLGALAAMPCVVRPTVAQVSPGTEQSDLARVILQRSDAVRFPQEAFEVVANIHTSEAGTIKEARLFKILSKGNENTLVLTVEPASERGQILLMKGRDLWFFLPKVSQPVRLSLSQRLIGQVSNGDIARANFVGDYNPTLVATESAGEDRLYVLDLAAVDRTVTYQKVRLWVKQLNYWPHKAEFYSLSGRLLKTCRFEEFRLLGGKVRPTKLVMSDALREGEDSTLEYSSMKLRELPDKIFTKEYLKRLD